MPEYSDGEIFAKSGQDHPKPGPHDSTHGANEDVRYPSTPGQVASSEFADAQPYPDDGGLATDPDVLDRYPKTHKSAGM